MLNAKRAAFPPTRVTTRMIEHKGLRINTVCAGENGEPLVWEYEIDGVHFDLKKLQAWRIGAYQLDEMQRLGVDVSPKLIWETVQDALIRAVELREVGAKGAPSFERQLPQ